jgi:hypothetical protein
VGARGGGRAGGCYRVDTYCMSPLKIARALIKEGRASEMRKFRIPFAAEHATQRNNNLSRCHVHVLVHT